MRHALLTLFLLMFAVHPALAQSDARPAAAKTYAAQGVTVELFAEDIPQGRAGVVRVSAPGLTDGQVEIFGKTTALFSVPNEDDALYGLIAPRLEQPIRTYDMTVRVTVNNERRALLVPWKSAAAASSGRTSRWAPTKPTLSTVKSKMPSTRCWTRSPRRPRTPATGAMTVSRSPRTAS